MRVEARRSRQTLHTYTQRKYRKYRAFYTGRRFISKDTKSLQILFSEKHFLLILVNFVVDKRKKAKNYF